MSKLKAEEIRKINTEMGENGQYSPLFSDEANEVRYTGISGTIESFKFGDNLLYSLVLKGEDNEAVSAKIPLVRGAEEKSIWNIGKFVALRDFTSAKGVIFEKGVTSRTFAY